MNRIRAFCSISGSFSRTELLTAGFVVLSLFIVLASMQEYFPGLISDGVSGAITVALYVMWGIALGKRSRDLGTTFTYGMLLGMFIPIIGILFLFQAGKKAKSTNRTETGPPPFGNQPCA